MPTPWTVLDRRTLLNDRFLVVHAERVRTGAGVILDPWYVVEAANWVTIVPLLPDGRLACVEQYRHGAAQVCLELPAGNIDAGEDATTAAIRELLEETGYRPSAPPIHLGTMWPEPSRSRATATGFLIHCAPDPQTQRLDHGEEITVHPLTFTEAEQQIVHGCQQAFLLRAKALLQPT